MTPLVPSLPALVVLLLLPTWSLPCHARPQNSLEHRQHRQHRQRRQLLEFSASSSSLLPAAEVPLDSSRLGSSQKQILRTGGDGGSLLRGGGGWDQKESLDDSSLGGVRGAVQGTRQIDLSRVEAVRAKANNFSGYLSNQELELFLKDFAWRRCRNISRLYSIGRSAMGFPLWVLQIGVAPHKLQPLPSFKYVGGLHGDEPVGRQLLLHFADLICKNYQHDPMVRDIVQGVQLHLLPALNPDGFTLHRRGNSKNVDLNRDFPDPWFSTNDNESLRQPEVVALMDWTRQLHFTASASLHGGALVANYPWDGNGGKENRYAACPDDATFRWLTTLYATTHPTMWQNNKESFTDGITNGGAWYPLYGGMQDWNYIVGECIDLTIELDEVKWPAPTALKKLWEDNRGPMLKLVHTISRMGIRGHVTSLRSGRPLVARVSVAGIDHAVHSRMPWGLYFRLLRPGLYSVTISCEGFWNLSVSNVRVSEGNVTPLNASLVPLDGKDREADSIQMQQAKWHRIQEGLMRHVQIQHQQEMAEKVAAAAAQLLSGDQHNQQDTKGLPVTQGPSFMGGEVGGVTDAPTGSSDVEQNLLWPWHAAAISLAVLATVAVTTFACLRLRAKRARVRVLLDEAWRQR